MSQLEEPPLEQPIKSKVVLTSIATADLERLTAFLIEANTLVQANKIIKLLTASFREIADNPKLGKLYQASQANEILTDVREIKVRFGKAGYQFLFKYDEPSHQILILAIRHFREQDYTLFS